MSTVSGWNRTRTETSVFGSRGCQIVVFSHTIAHTAIAHTAYPVVRNPLAMALMEKNN